MAKPKAGLSEVFLQQFTKEHLAKALVFVMREFDALAFPWHPISFPEYVKIMKERGFTWSEEEYMISYASSMSEVDKDAIIKSKKKKG